MILSHCSVRKQWFVKGLKTIFVWEILTKLFKGLNYLAESLWRISTRTASGQRWALTRTAERVCEASSTWTWGQRQILRRREGNLILSRIKWSTRTLLSQYSMFLDLWINPPFLWKLKLLQDPEAWSGLGFSASPSSPDICRQISVCSASINYSIPAIGVRLFLFSLRCIHGCEVCVVYRYISSRHVEMSGYLFLRGLHLTAWTFTSFHSYWRRSSIFSCFEQVCFRLG